MPIEMYMCVPKHALDPSDDLVGGWVRWLVEVDNSGRDVGLEVSLQWSASIWDWSEVPSANKNYAPTISLYSNTRRDSIARLIGILTFIIVLQQQWPSAGIQSWSDRLRLDAVILLLAILCHNHSHFEQIPWGSRYLSCRWLCGVVRSLLSSRKNEVLENNFGSSGTLALTFSIVGTANEGTIRAGHVSSALMKSYYLPNSRMASKYEYTV